VSGSVEVHELIDTGNQVVVWGTFRGRGSVRFQGFTDRDAALGAAGLRE
jgi:hypothetical protein